MSHQQSSTIDETQTAKIARLSKLAIDSTELEKYSKELSSIISYMEKIDSLETSSTSMSSPQSSSLKNVFREDVVTKSFTSKESCSGSPRAKDGHFLMPAVLSVHS